MPILIVQCIKKTKLGKAVEFDEIYPKLLKRTGPGIPVS